MPAFAAPGSAKRKSEADDSASRKRQAVQLTASTSGYNGGGKKSGEEYWMVQWYFADPHYCFSVLTSLSYLCRRAPQQRKHKTWDGDGVLIVAVNSGYCRLLDMDGKPCVPLDNCCIPVTTTDRIESARAESRMSKKESTTCLVARRLK